MNTKRGVDHVWIVEVKALRLDTQPRWKPESTHSTKAAARAQINRWGHSGAGFKRRVVKYERAPSVRLPGAKT